MDRFGGRDGRFIHVSAWSRPCCPSISRNRAEGAWSHVLELCLWRRAGLTMAAPDRLAAGETQQAQEWSRIGSFAAGAGGRLVPAPHDHRSWADVDPGCSHDVVEGPKDSS